VTFFEAIKATLRELGAAGRRPSPASSRRLSRYDDRTGFTADLGLDYCLFLNTGNVRKGRFDFSECQFISEEKDQDLRKGKLARNDLVMTTRGTIGNVAFYGDAVKYEHMRINSGMVILRQIRSGYCRASCTT